MNIVFFCSLNPHEINNWSGTTWHILKTLEKKHRVTIIGTHMLMQTANFALKNFSKKNAHREYSLVFGKLCSELIHRIPDCDLVFFGDLQLSPHLKIDIPLVHLSDVNYHLFKDYVPKHRTKEQDKATETKEKKLLNEIYSTIIYSSHWAKKNTIDYYGVDPEKIHVVEFGANIPHPTDYQSEIQMNVCNLVFIGRNWEKKGGDKVLGAYRKLKAEGFPCTCTLIGSVPPDTSENEDIDLTIIPFLDKSKTEHLDRLCNILRTAHFLILPTEFDAFGIVFCEASAYGVPSIAADVGGVSQPVREGKNGFLLPPDATAEDYAEKIQTLFSDKEKYLALRKSSRHEYETRLNWDVWGEKVNKIFEETVEKFKRRNVATTVEKNGKDKSDFFIPVYVINLKKRTDRRRHTEMQFQGKPEFNLTWIDAVEHPNGAVGLWKSMVKAVETAITNDDDIMIICEDDHTFTPAYSKHYLLANILGANEQGAELLSGGIGGFGSAVPMSRNRYWVDWLWCTQFIVVFKPLFQKILDYEFKDTDTADGVLSAIAKDKMTIYPFISTQTDFGYSDVTRANNEISGLITNYFRKADQKLNRIHHVAQKIHII